MPASRKYDVSWFIEISNDCGILSNIPDQMTKAVMLDFSVERPPAYIKANICCLQYFHKV